MPRRSAAEAARTRAAVVAEAVDQMSVLGASGTSLTAIADRLGMSKTGVVGPFGSLDALVVEAFDEAVATFRRQVVEPVIESDAEPGIARLSALIEAWIGYLVDSPFAGGCVMTSTSSELDGRTGPLRDRVRTVAVRWRSFLRSECARAVDAGHELPMSSDDTTDTLLGLAMALNQAIQLLEDPEAAARIADLMRRAIAGPSRLGCQTEAA